MGLHPRDVTQLVRRSTSSAIAATRWWWSSTKSSMYPRRRPSRGNRAGGRELGGRVIFQGTPTEMQCFAESLTGDYLAGPRRQPAAGHAGPRTRLAPPGRRPRQQPRKPHHRVSPWRPCLVTGVSGSGKSTLVQDTLYPALCRRLRKEAPKPAPYDDVFGDGQIDDVIMVDQSPSAARPAPTP